MRGARSGIAARRDRKAGYRIASEAAIRNVDLMILSFFNTGIPEVICSVLYVIGIAITVTKVTVTFGSVFSMPSIAFGGVIP